MIRVVLYLLPFPVFASIGFILSSIDFFDFDRIIIFGGGGRMIVLYIVLALMITLMYWHTWEFYLMRNENKRLIAENKHLRGVLLKKNIKSRIYDTFI